jgi:AraC-type DNA-binding domain-containing proteins
LILYGLQNARRGEGHPVVSRFMEMLFDRQQVTDTVSGYANRLGISPSYLNKLVRTQTRHSAMDWVEIARVNWAKNLLRENKLSISEVSQAVGIDDASYFTRFFRKVTGYTPSEFRKRELKRADWV